MTDVGLLPQDVDAADIDSDGDSDLVVVDFDASQAHVLLNNGDATFERGQIVLVGVEPTGVRLADFNDDGLADLVTLNQGSVSLSVLLNQGDGTFGPSQTIQLPHVPVGALIPWSGPTLDVGDLDGDGDLDVIVPSQGYVRLVLNDGAGALALSPTPLTAAGGLTFAVGLADLNGDGDLDIVSASMQSDDLSIFINMGDVNGVWQGYEPAQAVNVATPVLPGSDGITSLALGDFDGDGYADIALSAYNLWGVLVVMNQGKKAPAQFQPVEFRSSTDGVWGVRAADMDGNGLDDVVAYAEALFSGVATHLSYPGKPVHAGTQNVYKGFGGQVGMGPYVRHPRWVDVDRDGDFDVITPTSKGIKGTGFYVTLSDEGVLKGWEYHKLSPFAEVDWTCQVEPVDVNGDGWEDLVAVVPDNSQGLLYPGSIQIVLNDGRGGFGAPSGVYGTGDVAVTEVDAGDIDGDGDADLVLYGCELYPGPNANPTGRFLIVMTNDGNGAFSMGAPFQFASKSWVPEGGLSLADMDGDGDLDAVAIARGYESLKPGSLHVCFNEKGRFTGQLDYATPQLPFGVQAVDVTGDNVPDVVLACAVSDDGPMDQSYLQILVNDGSGKLQLRDDFTSNEADTLHLKVIRRSERREVVVYAGLNDVWVHVLDMDSGKLKSRTAYHATNWVEGFDIRDDGGPMDMVFACRMNQGYLLTMPELGCEAGTCKPDCDQSGHLDIDDFICFQTKFAVADPGADCNGSGGLELEDFICFQAGFAAGC